MKKILKIITSLALGFSLFVGFSPTTSNATAGQSTPTVDLSTNTHVDFNISSVDPTEPFIQIRQYKDAEGNPYTIGMRYTPSDNITPLSGGSSDSVKVYPDTWTASYDGMAINMSYDFDVEKSGTHWKISNPRNHQYSGWFTTFSDAKLSISRATSAASFPAEINASAEAKIFDNMWIQIKSATCLLWTKITDGGLITTYYN